MKMNYEQFLLEIDFYGNKHLSDEIEKRNKNNAEIKASSNETVSLKSWTETYLPWKNQDSNVIRSILPKLFKMGIVKEIQINGTKEPADNFIKSVEFIKKLKELFTTKPPKFTFKNGVINFDFS